MADDLLDGVSDVENAPQMKPTLAAKLARVALAIHKIEKTGFNEHFNYKFAAEADVVEAVRSRLAEEGIAFLASLTDIEDREIQTPQQGGGTKIRLITTCRFKFSFIDGATGEVYESLWAGRGEDSADKGLYKAMTGALKYWLLKTFMVPTFNDPEADGRTDKAAKARTQATSGPATEKQTGYLKSLIEKKAGRKDHDEYLKTALQFAAGFEKLTVSAAKELIDKLLKLPDLAPEATGTPTPVSSSGAPRQPVDDVATRNRYAQAVAQRAADLVALIPGREVIDWRDGIAFLSGSRELALLKALAPIPLSDLTVDQLMLIGNHLAGELKAMEVRAI